MKTITTRPDLYSDGLKTEVVLVVNEKSRIGGGNVPTRYGVGGVAKGQKGRKEFGGPMIAGPWHYVFGLCTVIDNYGGTGAEMAEKRAANLVVEVELGEVILIDGIKYVIESTFNGVSKIEKTRRTK